MFRIFVALVLSLSVHAELIDLTHTLSESTLVYPGKTPFSRVICAYYQSGYRIDDIALCTGVGTHMDAPNHFCLEGEGIEAVALERCVGSACVIHLSDKVQDQIDYGITSADIEHWESVHGRIPAHAIVLFHTGWDRYWGTERFCEPDENNLCHFPGIAEDGAKALVERAVSAVGIDTMGIDVGVDHSFIAHHILLGSGIPLVENLARLGELPATGLSVALLPMKIKDAPEAPVRAVAIIE